MIHEFIDPKKKTRASAPKILKQSQVPKTGSEEINFEASDSEFKESLTTVFIPPWLRNSLGLNQKNNLSHTSASADLKAAKLNHRGKEQGHNESEPLVRKKLADYSEFSQQSNPQDGVKALDNKSEKELSMFWEMKINESENKWGYLKAEGKPPKKEDYKDTQSSVELEKFKEEDKRRLRSLKQKHKLRKRLAGDSKQTDLDKNEMDSLLEMRAREALDNYIKADVHPVSSEARELEASLLLLGAKPQGLDDFNLNEDDEEDKLNELFQRVEDVNVRIVRNSEYPGSLAEKSAKEKEEKFTKEPTPKCKEEEKDKDFIASTDEEGDIKRFSEFLSKNKTSEEKRKCLEEVRNYFEKKRKLQLAKRKFAEEEKEKLNSEIEKKREYLKGKFKSKDTSRWRKSKFALCGEEVVEKAVDEALLKFIELYHFRVSPRVMSCMKKNILQALTSSPENPCSQPNLWEFQDLEGGRGNPGESGEDDRERERSEITGFPEADMKELRSKRFAVEDDSRKVYVKCLTENPGIAGHPLGSQTDFNENEKLRRLKKEFHVFLHSIQSHMDVTHLKLQSVILEQEEEEENTSSKNLHFVYNFTKRTFESETTGYLHSLREVMESSNRRDAETQTLPEMDSLKRSVRVQTPEQRPTCEKNLQTESTGCLSQGIQAEGEGVTMKQIKELKSSDVSPGLYRLVRSPNAGKFYLYPEKGEGQAENERSEPASNSCSVENVNLSNRNSATTNACPAKDKAKLRQSALREREKGKLKKVRKPLKYSPNKIKSCSSRKIGKKVGAASESSVSCLYMKNFDKKGSDSLSSKKEFDFTDEYLGEATYAEEEREREGEKGKEKEREREKSREREREKGREGKDCHLGCFWFWNGEVIAPGCDLKVHVESLLKEKLTQISSSSAHPNEPAFPKNGPQEQEAPLKFLQEKNFHLSNAKSIFCLSQENKPLDNEEVEERKKSGGVKPKETESDLLTNFPDKAVRSVGIQNSPLKFLMSNLANAPYRRKGPRRHIILKPRHKKVVSLKRAEEFLRVMEKIKSLKLGLRNLEKGSSSENSFLAGSSSTAVSLNRPTDSVSLGPGFKDGPPVEESTDSDAKNDLRELFALVDGDVQTLKMYDLENDIYEKSHESVATMEGRKHLDFIESVFSKINQQRKECLWNDVRNFIKKKTGKDINDGGAPEICIEIEQDMPGNQKGSFKHSVLSQGHYSKTDGDVEVEIDLTLEDLARLLRQRQKKNKRQNLYRRSKSRNLQYSSSAHTEFKEDLHRAQNL